MSHAGQFFPLLGAPARTTRYTSGSGTHTFLAGVTWCRVTVVAGGGKGGGTGSWSDGTSTFYEAGGGGGGGETRVFEFDPAQLLPGVSYAVGAGMSDSRFHSLVARKGANARNGAYETIGSRHYEGGVGGGTQDLYTPDDTNSAYIVPFGVWGAVGAVGGAKGSSGGAGGDSAFGQGGGGGAYATGTAAPLAACNNGSVGGGPGAGGGGAGGGADHLNSAGTRTLGVGADGCAGLIVVEEFVW